MESFFFIDFLQKELRLYYNKQEKKKKILTGIKAEMNKSNKKVKNIKKLITKERDRKKKEGKK